MAVPDFHTSYKKQTSELMSTKPMAEAMSDAVGGDFLAVGQLEYALLQQYLLKPDHTLIDVGCGSGRLAYQLKDQFKGRYIGLDIVPELYEYAAAKCARDDWKFYAATGLAIPEADTSADFVCFFSVVTHLLHEETFKYLTDAVRVLKPGGKIIFSFLEFAIYSHWAVFEQVLTDDREDKVLNQFISRDAIDAWAHHLDLQVVAIHDGDKPHIPLQETIRWDDGRVMTDQGNLGQSVCVLQK